MWHPQNPENAYICCTNMQLQGLLTSCEIFWHEISPSFPLLTALTWHIEQHTCIATT